MIKLKIMNIEKKMKKNLNNVIQKCMMKIIIMSKTVKKILMIHNISFKKV